MTRAAVRWYFDFLSPYAFLQSLRLSEIDELAEATRVPVLFAGLLAHWGTKGPAEVPPKRVFTFRHVAWLAHARGVAMRVPTPFPFNPLPLLRLSIVLGSTPAAVARLFDWVWREGRSPAETGAFDALCAEFAVTRERIEAAEVKAELRANTEAAIAAGVFGVPTTVIGDAVFWGQDATDMLLARLRGDPFFDSRAFHAAATLAPGVQRKP